MPSRLLSDLNAPTRKRVELFLKKCEAEGLDILVYCTLRSGAEQDDLFAAGRTKPGKIVTNARAGESWHQYGSAVDFVPMLGGKPQWDNKSLYARAGAIAESVGLEWAGRWAGSLKETAHIQYRGGLSLAQARAGKEIV